MTTYPGPSAVPFNLERPFTRREALAAGWTDKQLHCLVREGALTRRLRSVYVGAGAEDTLALRLEMLKLVAPPGSFFTDYTAAWVHAGDDTLPPNSHLNVVPIDIFTPPGTSPLRNAVVNSGERTLTDADLMQIDGVGFTTPLRTGCDLGRQRNRDMALWGLSSMMRVGGFSTARVMTELPRFKGMRWVTRLREVTLLADPALESFGEAALLNRWNDAGLPRPECQVRVERRNGGTYFIDLGLSAERFGVEYDGVEWHSSPDQLAHDFTRRQQLTEELGWRILAFGPTDTFGAHQDADNQIRRAWREHQG